GGAGPRRVVHARRQHAGARATGGWPQGRGAREKSANHDRGSGGGDQAGDEMIGLKTISAVAVALALVAIAAARGVLWPAYLASVSDAAWFAVGLVATLACALIGIGWRFGVASRGAVALVGGRPALVEEAEHVRELPGPVQRALVMIGFGALV